MIRRIFVPTLGLLFVLAFGSAYKPSKTAAEIAKATGPMALDKTFTIEAFPAGVITVSGFVPSKPTFKNDHVDWYPSFDVAREASRQSGKQVLVFQLLGQYGEEFC